MVGVDPGDIVLLEAGDRVPADARVLTAHNAEVAEAALTGESHAVGKHASALAPGAHATGRLPPARPPACGCWKSCASVRRVAGAVLAQDKAPSAWGPTDESRQPLNALNADDTDPNDRRKTDPPATT